MYKPKFNSVLVKIDDADAAWGSGNDESMLGKSYSKGVFIQFGNLAPTDDHPIHSVDGLAQQLVNDLDAFVGKDIMWNEGTEAGTTFDGDDGLYGLIYWWDIRGVKE